MKPRANDNDDVGFCFFQISYRHILYNLIKMNKSVTCVWVANYLWTKFIGIKKQWTFMNFYSVDELRWKVSLNCQKSSSVVNKNFRSIRDFETSYFIWLCIVLIYLTSVFDV